MNVRLIFLILFLAGHLSWAEEAAKPNFTNYKGDSEFREILVVLPLVAEVPGGRIIKMPDGKEWLIGTGSTPQKENSPSEIIRREKISRAKAQASIAEYLNGTNVVATVVSTDSTQTVIKNKKETAIATEQLDEKIVTRVKGQIKSVQVISTWTNLDGTIFYQAVGKLLK